jgi:hypothetical protein
MVAVESASWLYDLRWTIPKLYDDHCVFLSESAHENRFLEKAGS